jgi:hypothetical protein
MVNSEGNDWVYDVLHNYQQHQSEQEQHADKMHHAFPLWLNPAAANGLDQYKHDASTI